MPGPITSPTNPRVKAAVRLRDRREREPTGLTIVDGAREILRALDAGVARRDRVRRPGAAPDTGRLAVADRLRGRPATIEASPRRPREGRFGERSDGIVAIVETPRLDLDDLAVRRPDPLIVVAEGVEKPGNLGAVLRSADGAGADAVIAADPPDRPVQPERDPSVSSGRSSPSRSSPPSTRRSRPGSRDARDPAVAARVDAATRLHRRRPARPARHRARQRGGRA